MTTQILLAIAAAIPAVIVNLYALYRTFKRALVPTFQTVISPDEIPSDARFTFLRKEPRIEIVKKAKPPIYLFQAFLVTVGLFIADLGLVWGFIKLIGPIGDKNSTDIDLHPSWATVTIHSVGPIALFLAIAVIGLYFIFKSPKEA